MDEDNSDKDAPVKGKGSVNFGYEEDDAGEVLLVFIVCSRFVSCKDCLIKMNKFAFDEWVDDYVSE